MSNIQFSTTSERVRYVIEDGAVLTSRDVVVLIDGTSVGSNIAMPAAATGMGRIFSFRSVASSSIIERAGSDTIQQSSGSATSVTLSASGEFILLKPFGSKWVELWRNT